MASVYILYSEKLDRFYIGSCKDVASRIDKHFNKVFKKSFTAQADDWKLFFSMDNLGFAQARKIEMHIKDMKSRIYIRNLIKHSEISQKLITQYC